MAMEVVPVRGGRWSRVTLHNLLVCVSESECWGAVLLCKVIRFTGVV